MSAGDSLPTVESGLLDPFVHWGDENARPTSLHGNGAASFERVTLDPAEVTCGLCHYLLTRDTPPAVGREVDQ